MTKPDDASASAREKAASCYETYRQTGSFDIMEDAIARAIDAATKAAFEEARRLVYTVPVGELHQTNETDMKRLWRQASTSAKHTGKLPFAMIVSSYFGVISSRPARAKRPAGNPAKMRKLGP